MRRTNSGEFLKVTTLRALMTALVLVFGLRPIRSFLERTTKLPKVLLIRHTGRLPFPLRSARQMQTNLDACPEQGHAEHHANDQPL